MTRELSGQGDAIASLLVRSREEDMSRLEGLCSRIVANCALAPLDGDVIRSAFYLGRKFDLDPQDSFVLASVLSHLEQEPAKAAFVTKNTKDFDDPELRTVLDERGCQLLVGFGQALGYVLGGSPA